VRINIRFFTQHQGRAREPFRNVILSEAKNLGSFLLFPMDDRRSLAAAPSPRSNRAIAVRLLEKGDFPTASPALQLLLACNRVVHVAKVLKPNEPVQLIAFREALCLAASMLAQPAREAVRDANVERGAMLIGENVHPVVVPTHAVEIIRDVSLRST
jgi:hypothetical protein